MSKLLIIGNQNPEIGKEYHYSLSFLSFGGMPNNIFNPHLEITKWEIYVLENGKWRKTKGNDKQGDAAPYTFNQSSLTRKGIKILVTKGENTGELVLKPKRAGQPKINKIELLDINGNKVTKPLSYSDTLTVKAYCTDMEGVTVRFTLWEDDAKGEGHNKINSINKINAFPVPGTVKKGVAQANFNMATYTIASLIANIQVAKGDKNEGKTHEYYATAEYFGELEASNNVNLKNPTHHPNPTTTSGNKSVETKAPAQQKPNQRSVPPPPAPKKDTYKTPVTPKAKTQSLDPQGKIVSAEFVNMNGEPYKSMKFGTHVRAKIVSKNMTGKTVRLKIWEDDIRNVLLFEKDYILGGDETFITLFLTAQMRKDGDDWKEGDEQEYFLEIEYAGQSVDSEVINVNDSAPKIKVAEPAVSMTGVGAKKEDTSTTCICKEEYKDLVWGGKVSCDFRKKVIEICTELWPAKPMEMANELMTCMALETQQSFSPSKGYPAATGLVQFTTGKYGAITAMNETGYNDGKNITKDYLKELSAVEQLKYVKLYFQMWMEKYNKIINDALDMYMIIWCPSAAGKADTFVCYSAERDKKSGNDFYESNKSAEYEYYDENEKIAINRLKKDSNKGNGEITKGELKPRLKYWKELGKNHKVKTFECVQVELKIQNPIQSNSKIVFFDSRLAEDRKIIVSQFAISVVEKAAKNSSNSKVLITSTIRSTRKQAEVMYENESNGNHITYAIPGQQVVGVYNAGKRKGSSKEKIISDMDNKIKELSKMGKRVSLHCVSDEVYKKHNILDISYSREITNPRDLIRELIKDPAVTNIIHPLKNVISHNKIKYDAKEKAIHVEIKVP